MILNGRRTETLTFISIGPAMIDVTTVGRKIDMIDLAEIAEITMTLGGTDVSSTPRLKFQVSIDGENWSDASATAIAPGESLAGIDVSDYTIGAVQVSAADGSALPMPVTLVGSPWLT